MRIRSGVVLIKHDSVALIKRIFNNQTYYVFPGGGVENNETPQECAKRETLEELGLKIEIDSLFLKHECKGTDQYYFSGHILSGEFGTGKGEEFVDNRNRGQYIPQWLKIEDLSKHEVRPPEVASKLVQQYFSGNI
ncbi:NUDIX hydrolase [Metabacillus halosaccharovorans]|uniref:NUDIX hydrolase n=1 Tax=Metabacillus halosaccharovorans TaxID=930124 RepID=UPI000C8094CD|nr:NUDIX domain-containing protein [Metabacillus halosaccharovorans]MCM3444181.1 NUDIX domain-containing protein [Metabacillus halosaccharovorans]PMC36396.1 DNA mismatch repair protein MutT [Bacillus sp. UMB0899]